MSCTPRVAVGQTIHNPENRGHDGALPPGMKVRVDFVEQQDDLPGDPDADQFCGPDMFAP